jgi:hypothetical protein
VRVAFRIRTVRTRKSAIFVGFDFGTKLKEQFLTERFEIRKECSLSTPNDTEKIWYAYLQECALCAPVKEVQFFLWDTMKRAFFDGTT